MPYYETDSDINNAIIAAEQINNIYLRGTGIVHHFKKASPIDIGISYKGKLVYPLSITEYSYGRYTILIEHKQRSHRYGKYPTIWLSLSKYDMMTRVPNNTIVLFMVTWLNATGFINTAITKPLKINIDKRTKDNRPDDSAEPIVEFNIIDFTLTTPIH